MHLVGAGNHWLWSYDSPDQQIAGDLFSHLASCLRPLEDAAQHEFCDVIQQWDAKAFLGPEVHLVLFDRKPPPPSSTYLAEQFSRFDAGAESDIRAYVWTLQDQTYSFVYYSSDLAAWIDHLVTTVAEGPCHCHDFSALRFTLPVVQE